MSVDWRAHLARPLAHLGVVVTWTSQATGDGVSVTGLLTREPVEIALGLAGVTGTRPRFQCMAAAVPGVKRGDRIETEDALRFVVAEPPKIDATTGVADLELKDER